MLRINLLPPSVNQRRLNTRINLAGAIALAACIAVPLVINGGIVGQVSRQRQDADAAVQGKAITDGLKAQADAATALIGPIAAKLAFAKAVPAYNDRLVNMFYNVAKYTDSKIIYSDATYTGSVMTIKAYSPSIAELGRYLQRIYTDPDFSSVTIDKIPGYPDAYYSKYYVGKTLVSIGTPPSGGGAAQNGPGGLGGRAGFGGQSQGGQGQGGPFSGASNGAGSAAFDEQGNPVTPLQTLVQRNVSPLTQPRQIAELTDELSRSVYAKQFAQGFTFTVTATMVNPPVAPVVPGTPGGAGGAGGFPGAGGPPPGFGGPPPGFGGPPPGFGGPPAGAGGPARAGG